jgi:tRNA nucleotidyltransferase (CCA-adding enzyme)
MNNAKIICKRLQDNQFQAYIVGGAVRDTIRGKAPKDYDICTNASPADIARIFPDNQILNIGVAFGITTVIFNGVPYEIAQFRKDVGVSDGRHPASIDTCDSIQDDLARRDFTCNAMALDPISGDVIDPFNGRADIDNKVIRFVGNPIDRIHEDSLRILRAFRFMSQLGFSLADDTRDAIISVFARMGKNIFEGVSQERITAEFSKIITGANAFATIKLLAEIEILDVIVPVVSLLREPHNNRFHTEVMDPFGNSILAHTLFVFQFACAGTDKLVVRLAALLHDIGKSSVRSAKPDGTDRFLKHDIVGARLAHDILIAMKFDSKTVDAVSRLVLDHMNIHDIQKMRKQHKIRRMLGRRDFDDLLALGLADTLGTAGMNGVPNSVEANLLIAAVQQLRSQFDVMLPAPMINGNDLINAGVKPGPAFKKALDVAYNYQLDGELKKDRLVNQALSYIRTVV